MRLRIELNTLETGEYEVYIGRSDSDFCGGLWVDTDSPLGTALGTLTAAQRAVFARQLQEVVNAVLEGK